MPPTFTQDFDRLKRFFRAQPLRLAREVYGPASVAAGKVAARRAKALAPARTGLLRSAIRAYPADSRLHVGPGGKKKVDNSAAALWAGSPADYALFVERGTDTQPAQEFLSRALRQARSTSMYQAFLSTARARAPKEWR